MTHELTIPQFLGATYLAFCGSTCLVFMGVCFKAILKNERDDKKWVK